MDIDTNSRKPRWMRSLPQKEDLKIFKVPTGHICIMEGQRGLPLEFLSIGDYGKEKNIKADFLGFTKEINGVPHGELLPLEEKWVVTISSQYGCSMDCTFCDVPKVGRGKNASLQDMVNQIIMAMALHPEVKHTKRLNLHFARMGEPTWNPEVIRVAFSMNHFLNIMGSGFHPVVSTMMPKNNRFLEDFLREWLLLKVELNGEAGLQLSINTTDEEVRQRTMPHARSLDDISQIMKRVIQQVGVVRGRKITLNFALTEAEIDADLLRRLFNPEHFLCKITPMHHTRACVQNGLITNDGYDAYYPYADVESRLKAAGFDVIVFIPSHEEDESRITCGNAILADIKSRGKA